MQTRSLGAHRTIVVLATAKEAWWLQREAGLPAQQGQSLAQGTLPPGLGPYSRAVCGREQEPESEELEMSSLSQYTWVGSAL